MYLWPYLWTKEDFRQRGDEDLKPVSFYLNTGDFETVPKFSQFSQPLSNPDLARDLFVEDVMKHISVIGVTGVSKK